MLLVLLYKYYLKPRKNRALRKINSIGHIIGIVSSVLLLFDISRFNYPGNKVGRIYNEYVTWTGFNQLRKYK